jgi:ABC-type uncharacterized transport system substrate-binding protein
MRRRDFITGTAATAAMGFAQPIWAETNARSTGVKRIAVVYPGEISPPDTRWRKAFIAELKRLGYIEGQNLIVEPYAALGQTPGELARQIIASRPDVIMPLSGPFINEVMALTTSIPMVGPVNDPEHFGWTTSLARPDRNYTGVVLDAGLEIWAKRGQLLQEIARKVTKLGYLDVNPAIVAPDRAFAPLEAAQRAGIATAYVMVAGKIDRAAYERLYDTVIVSGENLDRTAFEQTFEAMEKEGVDGLVVGDQLFAYGQLVVDLAARFRVPAIYPFREFFVEVGGLMSYGVDLADVWRRVAGMTGQVLGGAKVSDIPFYRQTKYELVLNQKTATSLGLEFPTTLLTTADEVIE